MSGESTVNGTFLPAVVLITGGAGFIGSNLVRWILRNVSDVIVVNLDLLTYAGNIESLQDVVELHGPEGSGRYFFIRADIRDSEVLARVLGGVAVEQSTGRRIPSIDAVLHLAAESHVDRSILGPAAFISTNVVGTHTLLECVRAELSLRSRPFRFVNVSTDEVYGSLAPEEPAFTEAHPLAPNSPYSASKAGADCLVRAYRETFHLPVITTRCSNNYGPFQFPEKLVPLMITKAMQDEPLPLYGDGLNVRDWLHVEDHVSGIWMTLTRGQEGEVYNLGGDAEITNLELVRMLLDELGRPHSLINFVADRPGHDRRYAMNATKSQVELGWAPRHTLANGLRETTAWYAENRDWWVRVKTKAQHPMEIHRSIA